MKEHHHLDLLEQKARALDPRLLLKRGYSLTLHEGKVVKDAKQLRPGTSSKPTWRKAESDRKWRNSTTSCKNIRLLIGFSKKKPIFAEDRLHLGITSKQA